MRWANFFHIYQPAGWDEAIVKRVADESYRPFLRILSKHEPVKVTLHLAGSLTEQFLRLGMRDIIDGLQQCVARGQIELVGGAMYHPILPLIPLAEVERQIDLQDALHRRVFGKDYHPTGFFAPEMAFSPSLETLLIDRGYAWIILDEISHDGTLGHLPGRTRYTTGGGLGVVYRHRALSDFLAFRADVNQPDQAIRAIMDDERGRHGFVTAMDGENLGHHRHGVDRLWEMLVTQSDITSVTVSEFRAGLPMEATTSPVSSSWSSQPFELQAGIPFGLWSHPDNPIHAALWDLVGTITTQVREATNDPRIDDARQALDQNMSSDKFWWASASPWWEPTIVRREIARVANVISPLSTLSASSRRSVERLASSAAQAVDLWEQTGLARQRQKTYLAKTGATPFMAGSPVSAQT